MILALHISAEEKRYLAHLPPNLKRKIRMALDGIRRCPGEGKELIEKLSGMRSYKVGRFRVVYRVHPGAIPIIAVGPRETVYQKVALEIGRAA